MMQNTHTPSRRPRGTQANQQGIVLLEALCGLLIFAVGILGLIGLQLTSIKQAAAAEYRSTAVLQANDLISRMWVSDRTAATLQAQFASATSGATYTAWKTEWAGALPGTGISGNAPKVEFTTEAGGGSTPVSSSRVTVTIYWQAPNETAKHNFSVVAQLK